jgi:hypothetical protein
MKHIIWPIQLSSPLYNLCPLQEVGTCLHLLSMCMNTTFNNIQTTKHDKMVWQIHILLLSHSPTRDTFLINIGTHLINPHRTQSFHGYTHASTPQDHSVAHMRAPPPLGQAEDDDFHPGWMAGPPSAGEGGGADHPPQPGRGGSASISHIPV